MGDGEVEELADVAKELRASVMELKSRISFNRTWNIVLSALVALKLATIVVLVFVIVQLYHTQDTANTTRRQVLCPLYSLFAQSVNQPRGPAETAEQYAARQAAKPQILKSYQILSCS
jgi:hypothetical protein